MRHRTWDHQQKPWLHQNSNSRSIMYDPGGISNDSTFSGATQASSDDITGQATLLRHTRCSLLTTTTTPPPPTTPTTPLTTTPMPPPPTTLTPPPTTTPMLPLTTPTTFTSAATQAMLQGSTLAGRCKV